jgi:hypothetical protein
MKNKSVDITTVRFHPISGEQAINISLFTGGDDFYEW